MLAAALDELLATSPSLAGALRGAARGAATEAPILILGAIVPGEAERVVARDISDFERVLRRRIMTLPGVGDVEANVLLSEELRPGPIDP